MNPNNHTATPNGHLNPSEEACSETSKSETNPGLIARFSCGKFDVFALGLAIVIGGQYFSWNAGLSAGFGSFIFATILMGTAYICLCLCVSEISSALPFAGGAYGLARCTLGFFSGFMVGCCEAAEYICYVALAVSSLATILSDVVPGLGSYQPVVWIIFYLSALAIHIYGRESFWRFSTMVGIVSLLVILVYCFGSLPFIDFHKNVGTSGGKLFVGGLCEFIKVVPVTAWFFVGVESLNTASDDVMEPRRNIPWGQMMCIVVLNITACMVVVISCSLPIGIDSLANDPVPLNTGKFLEYVHKDSIP